MKAVTTFAYALLVSLPVLAAGSAAAQYLGKPVRMIVPFPPGGSNDIVARMIGNEMTGRLGQQVIIDNRGGAGGIIGSGIAASSAPDGYTLLIISVAYAYNPAIYKSRLKFDPEKSFVPVAMLGTGPNVLAVNPKVPVNTVKELIAMAKAKPGSVAYATAGLGSFQHLGSEMFRLQAGIDMPHVPFKGGGPAMADAIAGNTQVAIGSLLQTIPVHSQRQVKGLGRGQRQAQSGAA